MRALIAFDGSDRSHAAIKVAADLFGGAEVVVLTVGTVLAVGDAGDGTEAATRACAEEGVKAATAAGLRATPAAVTVPGGSTVSEAIVKAADEHGAEVIVIAAPDENRLRSAVLGTVSNGVVKRARRPVVVVPTGF